MANISIRVDPFYNKENQAHLERGIKKYNAGKSQLIYKTMEALEDEEKHDYSHFFA